MFSILLLFAWELLKHQKNSLTITTTTTFNIFVFSISLPITSSALLATNIFNIHYLSNPTAFSQVSDHCCYVISNDDVWAADLETSATQDR